MKKKVAFKVFGQNVLVYAPKVDEKTKAGIIKSEVQIKKEKQKSDKYLEVAGVGSEITYDINIGDKVLLAPATLNGIDIDKTTFVIIHELSILGKKI